MAEPCESCGVPIFLVRFEGLANLVSGVSIDSESAPIWMDSETCGSTSLDTWSFSQSIYAHTPERCRAFRGM
jgi:hypothetical protein